jgi:lysophospholipase L1-like esterase
MNINIFGDSNAAGCRRSHGYKSIKDVLLTEFKKFASTVNQYAKGGTTISTGDRGYLEWLGGRKQNLPEACDLSIVMIGTNDITFDSSIGASLRSQFRQILKGTGSEPRRTYVLAPIHGRSKNREKAKEIRAFVQAEANSYGAHYMELYPRDDEWQKSNGSTDYIHVNADFHHRIIQYVQKDIKVAIKEEPPAKRRKKA